jgi:hypothetical protein
MNAIEQLLTPALRRIYHLAGYPYYRAYKQAMIAEIKKCGALVVVPMLLWVDTRMDEIYWDKGIQAAIDALREEVKAVEKRQIEAVDEFAFRTCLYKFGFDVAKEHYPTQAAKYEAELVFEELGGIHHTQLGDLFPAPELQAGQTVLVQNDDEDFPEDAQMVEAVVVDPKNAIARLPSGVLVQSEEYWVREAPVEKV